MKLNQSYIAAQAKIFKALGHPSRLTMVTALQEGEKCVCELQQMLGFDMSTISKHLAILKEAGVVSTEKKGTSVYAGIPIGVIEEDKDGAAILADGEIYAIRMGVQEYVSGLQAGGMEVIDLGLNRTQYETLIEWICGIAVFHPKAAARLYSA